MYYSYLLVMAVIWPIITALILILARTISFSAGQHNTLFSLTPSYHKFHDEPSTRSVDDSTFDNRLSSSSISYSDAMLNRLHLLADTYPNYVTLTTTQDLFGEGQQQQQQHSYALIIQDKQQGRRHNDAVDDVLFTSQFVGTNNMSFKDAVDWFHASVGTDSDTIPTEGGNEQEEKETAASQPTTNTDGDIILSAEILGSDKVFGLASVMLESANCESIPSSGSVDDSNDKTNYLASAIADHRLRCRTHLEDQGVSTKDVEWLANLVFTRRTIVLPPTAAATPVPHHHHGSFNLPWLVVACVSLLLLTATLLTLIMVRRKKKHRNRIWLEEEAKRQIAEVDDNYEYYESLRKDFTSELTSFDEELTVQLIEPSHNVVLV